jgi:general secretion pathway protein B
VPGLHAPVLPPAAGAEALARPAPQAWALGALALAIAAGLAFWLLRPVAVVTPAAAGAAAPASATVAAALPIVAPPVMAANVPPPLPAPAAVPQPAPTPSRAPTAAVPAPPPPAERLPTLAELPEAQRRALPPLALAGGMYSAQPAQRLVILDGQVVHEGDEPAPGLRVERIRPRAVEFSFQGLRFEQRY